MEQYVRDARSTDLRGHQHLSRSDLLGRKVLGDNGAKLKKFGKIVTEFVEKEGTNEAMQEFVETRWPNWVKRS